MDKYDNLVEKAQLIKAVGSKINDLIDANNRSIEWYKTYIEEHLAENPDWDASYSQGQIEELEKENAMIREVEEAFWKKHGF